MIELSASQIIIDWKNYVGEKTSLVLSGMNITDEQVEELADVLKTNITVRSLDLSNNKITKKGAISIAEALRINKVFMSNPLWDTHQLNLYGNPIGKEGSLALFESLCDTGRYLHCIYLGQNGVSNSDLKELEKNEKVRQLHEKVREFRTLTLSYWQWK